MTAANMQDASPRHPRHRRFGWIHLAAVLLGAATLQGVASAARATVDLNQFGVSGTWYDPTQSGQGFVISVMPNVDGKGHAGYFGGWFTFADHFSGEHYQQALGSPMWLTLQGDTSNIDPTYGMRLQIFDNDGRNGVFAAPPAVPASQLGWASLSMADCNHLHLHYTVQWRDDFINPQWQDMDLVRLMPNVSCVDTQTPPAAPPGANFTSAWYDPAVSGQGFAFEINPILASDGYQKLFGGWFTYAADNVDQSRKGRRWYTLQGEVRWMQPEFLTPLYLVGCGIGIYETTGGTFAAPIPIRQQSAGGALVLRASNLVVRTAACIHMIFPARMPT